jgi:sugar O-acyltransferase (sialic acid O-acetyltransferase NeuD family)
LGAGNQARETLSFYKDLGKFENVKGLIEQKSAKEGTYIDGKKVIDSSVVDDFESDVCFIGAMGSPLRKRWIIELESKGFDFDTLIHPSAIMNDFVEIGKGCIIAPRVTLTRNIIIGKHSIVNIGCNISHDCKIKDFVTVCPGVNLGGNVKIGEGCWIGIGVTVSNGASIGEGSLVGAGAVVVNNVPDNCLAVGIPAKAKRKLSECDWNNLV